MATKNPEKRNLLKAHKVARDHLRRASYVLRAINAHLLDKLLGPKSSEDDNPLNEQRKEEEDYLNVFLNQEDFGAEVLNHFCNLISKVSNSDGGNTQEQDSGQMFQITDGSIQGDNGPNLVPNSSETQSSQNETSNKRRNEDKLELAGPSTKQQKISVPRENQNDETYKFVLFSTKHLAYTY